MDVTINDFRAMMATEQQSENSLVNLLRSLLRLETPDEIRSFDIRATGIGWS